MAILKIDKARSEDNCPNCARYLKENTDLKEAFLQADIQSVRQCKQYEDELSYAYRLLEDYKAEIEWLTDEHNSGSQARKGVKRLTDQSNTHLRAPSSLNW